MTTKNENYELLLKARSADKAQRELPLFTPIFNGLDDHLALGKLPPAADSVFMRLLRHCNWITGIYFGCAGRLKALYGGTATESAIAQALGLLKRNRLIYYHRGNGKRGSYPIAINRHFARSGILTGFRVNAFVANGLRYPLLECNQGDRTVTAWSFDGGYTVVALTPDGSNTVRVLTAEAVATEAAGESRNTITPISITTVKRVRILDCEEGKIHSSSLWAHGYLNNPEAVLTDAGDERWYCSKCALQFPTESITAAHELFCEERDV